MNSTQSSLRILGLSIQSLADFRATFSRYAGLFSALERRYELVGFVRPVLPKMDYYRILLRSVHPRKKRWVARAAFNSSTFWSRTAVAERELAPWESRYDVILQLQTLFAPGLDFKRRYTIYTDNIYPLTERFYPAWSPLSRRQGAIWSGLEEMTCQNAATVLTMSEFVRQAVIDEYHCDPARVIRVGGGANSFTKSVAGKDYSAQIALFVGDKFEIKGGHTLLAAWDLVQRELPEAQLWIVGPKRPYGPARTGVRWLGYVADRATLSDLYTRASVFVLPSHFEAWGHVFPEAMGHGLPCIGTRQFAMAEIIEDGATGLLVPPRDAKALGEALVALLFDSARARSMGHRAHAAVLSGLTWDHVVARMAPHLEAAAREPKPSRPNI